MYLDRDADGVVTHRLGPTSAERQAVEARATLDPDILRRWRKPDETEEAESPREGGALVRAHPAHDENSAAAPAQAPRRRRPLSLIGLALAVAAGAGGWFGYHWWTV